MIVDAANVSLHSFQISGLNTDRYDTSIGGGTITSDSNQSSTLYDSLWVSENGEWAIRNGNGSDGIIVNCKITATGQGGGGILPAGPRTVVCNNLVDLEVSSGLDGIGVVADDCVVTGNTVRNPDRLGIQCGEDDCTVGANRIHGAGEDGIKVQGTDNIVYNNRISGSGLKSIKKSGSGTVYDSNLTGPSN